MCVEELEATDVQLTDQQLWDQQIEEDLEAGRLNAFLTEAENEYEQGKG